tara:strand:+ start:2400 stop:2522 length:123 start_codon:yes stop_codon:yes gene_type:complete
VWGLKALERTQHRQAASPNWLAADYPPAVTNAELKTHESR